MAGLTTDQLSARGVAKGNAWAMEYGDGPFGLVQVLERIGLAPETAAAMAVTLIDKGQDSAFVNGLIVATVCYEEKLGVTL